MFIFCILYLVSPCIAGNLLQQEYEVNNATTDIKFPINYNKLYLLKEDYYGYLNGKKSIYGGIIYLIEKNEKDNIPNKALNLRYLNLAKAKFDKIILIQNSNLDQNIRLNSLASKIIIDDEDYQKLSTDIKEAIRIMNTILAID